MIFAKYSKKCYHLHEKQKHIIVLQNCQKYIRGELMNFTKPVEISRSTHYGNNFFAVYSNKIHRVCHFYSNLEYYNFLSLEIDPKVDKFCEQPLRIELLQENKLKHAIFDMWVLYRNGKEELQEVKYYSELTGNDPESLRSQEQIRREEHWCKDNNIDFVIRTDKTISKGYYFLNNANTIAAHLRRYVPTDDVYYNTLIINALEQNGELTIKDLICNDLLPIGSEISHLCYMYEKGLIDLNINNLPLSNRTEVSLWKD